MLRRLQFFDIFTSTCAFRHSARQFFDIWTDKSGPNMRCFVHFYFQMCFSPQRQAIFRHLNRQKWSKHAVFCTFLLSNVLFATAPGNFSTSEQTKVLRSRHVLYIFTFKCAFRHSARQFFDIWTDMFCTFLLQNVLFATAACNFWFRLSAPTSPPAALTGLLLDWPDTRIYEKTQHFVTSLTFGADVSSFF